MKNDRYKYLLKNTGILTLSNFSSKILIFLLIPLYTSVLSTKDYGIYDLLYSTIQLLYPILTINITDSVMRFSMDKNIDKSNILSIALKYFFSSIVIIFLLLLENHILNLWNDINGLEIYVIIYYISYSFHQLFIQYAKGNEKVKEMGIAGILSTIFMLIFNILFLCYFKLGLIGFLLANILSHIIPSIYLIIKMNVIKIVKYKKDKILEKEMLIYCAPLLLTTISWWINSTSDKYIVAIICGLGANGILSIAYKIPSILNTIQSIFIQAWQISAIKEYDKNDSKKFYTKMFLSINAIMCICCFMLISLNKLVAKFLFSNDFYEARIYVPFLLISCLFNAAAGFLGPILSAKKDSKNMAISAIFGSIANIVLNIIFVKLIGIQGVTIATAISSLIIYIIRRITVRRELSSCYDIKIIVSWIALMVQSINEIYFNVMIVNPIILIIIIYIYKDFIINIISKLKKGVIKK